MSPRLDVADVSTATEGSAPWPPGRTVSGPNEGADGCFAGDGLAPAWGAIASVATADRARASARRRSRLGASTGGELTATGCLPCGGEESGSRSHQASVEDERPPCARC